MAHYRSTIVHTVSATQPPVAQDSYTQFYNRCMFKEIMNYMEKNIKRIYYNPIHKPDCSVISGLVS